MKQYQQSRGFTLIELMIVLAIVAILLVVSLPAYNKYSERSRRGDAVASLLKARIAQEEWRADDTDYGTLVEIWSGTDSLEGHYTLAVTASSAGAYTITATPKVGGLQVGDECGTYAANQGGPLYTGYASADCWRR